MSSAVILAAGEGRRLGRPKAGIELGGRALLTHVLDTCRTTFLEEIVVVLGAEADTLRPLVVEQEASDDGPAVRVVVHDDWAAGRTGSLQAGLRALTRERDGALVFPVDHPLVRVTTLDAVLGVFNYAAAQPEVVVPCLETDGERRRGHPVLVAAALREAIQALGPDDPLNTLLRSKVRLEVPVDDEAVLLDIDEPADLERAERLLAERAE
ncbi:MAG: nucleotidyltransferase family protein [Acidobacteriota bacterium]